MDPEGLAGCLPIITQQEPRPAREGVLMETSKESTLKPFKVARFEIDEERGSYTMLEVTCPWRKCRRSFWVRLSWRTSSEYKTRPCPYCFKTAIMPAKGPRKNS